ncbi:MAG: hypothetical protein ABI594_09905 [Ginsengibacter sp.]
MGYKHDRLMSTPQRSYPIRYHGATRYAPRLSNIVLDELDKDYCIG